MMPDSLCTNSNDDTSFRNRFEPHLTGFKARWLGLILMCRVLESDNSIASTNKCNLSKRWSSDFRPSAQWQCCVSASVNVTFLPAFTSGALCAYKSLIWDITETWDFSSVPTLQARNKSKLDAGERLFLKHSSKITQSYVYPLLNVKCKT